MGSPQLPRGDVGDLFLEERQFAACRRPSRWADRDSEALDSAFETADRLDKQLVVLSDWSFTWFARYGLAINARNVLDEKTKTSKNLWYEAPECRRVRPFPADHAARVPSTGEGSRGRRLRCAL